MTLVKKRNGKYQKFDAEKIYDSIINTMHQTKKGVDEDIARLVTDNVVIEFKNVEYVDISIIKDSVENFLMYTSRVDVAKEYILNRDVDNKTNYKLLSDEFLSKYKDVPAPMEALGNFVYYRTYSRYLPDKSRREFWWETCARAVDYNCSLVGTTGKQEAEVLFDNMFNLRQFLSGRTLWVGGTEVAEKFPMSNFNCAFQVIDSFDDISQLLYLLLLGSGVGIRINKSDVEKLPKIMNNIQVINKQYKPLPKEDRVEHTSVKFDVDVATITIGDSKTGWVDALKFMIDIVSKPQYSNMKYIVFDYNSIRPKGEKLKTFGGTASGHGALEEMLTKIDKVFKRYEIDGKTVKLKPIDILDIANIIGEGVVVGGVRRTAEIVLFDSDDQECIEAKSELYKQVEGQWIVDEDIIHRQMSNNSIWHKSKPTRDKLHWQIEKMRYSGEPAFINEEAGAKRRDNFNGVNPCGEILLDSKGMCNLTTINVMSFVETDYLDTTTFEDGTQYLESKYLNVEKLLQAQRLSARAGYRMTCVDLELPQWNIVQKRDRLIGCSLTGWQDMVNAVGMSKSDQADLLTRLRLTANMEASSYSKALGMNAPLLVTTVKPEGTLSQLPTVSSGVHYSHSPYYIRRIRVNSQDPVVKVCEELGYPIKAEIGQDLDTCKTKVVEFPVKAPEGRTKYDVSAIEQLENYKMFMEHYVDHNCSITVHVREHEWEEVEQWIWDNWSDVVAVSFLALDDSFYDLLPYESITEAEYIERSAEMKPFLPSLISKYEVEEQELEVADDPSCSSGICPVR